MQVQWAEATKAAIMGYICPDCGEGLPEDELCPCQSGNLEDYEPQRSVRGPLTAELDDVRSPVREFLNEHFSAGLREVQRRYRERATPLIVPGVPRGEADPGTIGGAADWMLRFLVHPRPSLALAVSGAVLCERTGACPGMVRALGGIASSLGLSPDDALGKGETVFAGPLPGNDAEPGHLTRACWALALLTEVRRRGARVAMMGPLSQFRDHAPSRDELLSLVPPAGLDQLSQIRQVLEQTLLRQLASWPGPWTLGPTFAGSDLIGGADADLIAAGLLLELKTSAKRISLPIIDLLQVIAYALLDFDDEYQLGAVGTFNARYAYLSVWELGPLLDELSGQDASLRHVREEFRQMLLEHQARPMAGR